MNLVNKSSYLETHYVVVQELEKRSMGDLKDYYLKGGRGGMWMLAEHITDDFERIHADKDWDGDWEDTLINFIEYYILNNYK